MEKLNSLHQDHKRYVIGIDIGGTNLRVGAVTSAFRLLDCQKVSSREMLNTPDPAAVLLQLVQNYMSDHPAMSCAGICIGIPGTVSQDKRRIFSCPNVPSLSGIDIVTPLEQALGIPAAAEHDVILLLANDMLKQKLRQFNTIIGLYIGTGLGNALYINEKFLTGKNGVSGELGHIPVAGSTRPCPCGSTGCMELYCAGKRLEEIKDQYFPEIDFASIFSRFDPAGPLGEYMEYMAMAAATEINILDPDCILISGGVSNMPDFPYEYLQKRIYHYTRKPYPADNLLFVRGESHPFSGVSGAGIYLWDSDLLKNAKYGRFPE